MPIKGLSEKRRLPRMGKIRLGIKVPKKSGEGETMKEVDYFVCPPIVQKTYGPEPKELIIVFPIEDEEKFFQQFYMKWGYGVLQCKGDGEEGTYFDFDQMKFLTRKCPCPFLEQKKCGRVGRLQFMLPEVEEAAGVWQIDTTSKNSIMDINSGIDYIRSICGRISMIPIKLIRSEIETQHPDKKEKAMKKGRHWTMKFSLEGVTLATLQRYGQTDPRTFFLPEPDPNQPEDLRAVNGSLPEQEESQTGEGDKAPAPAEKSPHEGTQAEVKKISLTLSDGKRRRLTREEVEERYEAIKGTLGDERFFDVLGANSFTMIDEIPDKDLNKIYGELLQAWSDSE